MAMRKPNGKTSRSRIAAWRRDHDAPALAEKLLQIREIKNLSLQEASDITGVAASTLSKIENGKMSPTFDVLTRIMRGLHISPAFLFSSSTGTVVDRPVALDRRKTPIIISIPGADYEILCADNVPKDMFPAIVTINPGNELTAHHPGEQFVLVTEGTLGVTIGESEPLRLQKGECLYFDSMTPHVFEAYGKSPVRFLSISNRTALEPDAGIDGASPVQYLRGLMLRESHP